MCHSYIHTSVFVLSFITSGPLVALFGLPKKNTDFKGRRVAWVEKHLKEDWFIVLVRAT